MDEQKQPTFVIIPPERCKACVDLFYFPLQVHSVCPGNTDTVYVFKGPRSPGYLSIPFGCMMLGPEPEIPKATWTAEFL